LVDACHEGVWRCVAAFGLERETLRDLVQQAFVDAYRKLEDFRADGDFGAWVRGIAKNLARKELRQSSCRHRHQERYRAYLLQRQESHDDDPSGRLDALRRCRDRLPEHSRDLLERYYAAEESLESIAALLKRSVSATKQLLWRTRTALRRCIEGRSEAVS
jgi:RNA polymerase sigma-70 factor (ECF subfamily)